MLIIALSSLVSNLAVFLLSFKVLLSLIISFSLLLILNRVFLKSSILNVVLLSFLVFTVSSIYRIQHQLHWQLRKPDQFIWAQWRVLSIQHFNTEGYRMQVALEKTHHLEHTAAIATAPRLWVYSSYSDIPFKIGEVWQCPISLHPLIALQNSGVSGPQMRWLINGLRASAKIKNVKLCHKRHLAGYWGRLQQLRYHLYDTIIGKIDVSPSRGVLAALLTGIREQVSVNTWRIFRDTGTSHLMAISGLHIALISYVVYQIIYRFWSVIASSVMRLAAYQVAACSALLAALLYSLVAGLGVATQRALVMLSMLMLAKLRNIKLTPWHNLACAILICLVCEPLTLLHAGFALSFAAVTCLIYVSYGRLGHSSRVSAYCSHGQLALGLLPLTLYDFAQVSWLSILANIIAIPWMSILIVPWCLLATVMLVLCPQCATLLYKLVAYNLDLLLWLLHSLASLAHSQWYHRLSSPMLLGLASLQMIWLLAPRGIPQRYFACCWCLPLLIPLPHYPRNSQLWLDVLDVGQGLAVVIRTARHILLYDTGDHPWHSLDRGETVVIPFLHSQGMKGINTVILSHADRDHIGGYMSINKQMKIHRVLAGDYQRMQAVLSSKQLHPCIKGQHWQWDGVRFDILHPKQQQTQANDASCVLRVQLAEYAIWLPGDISANIERQLISQSRPFASYNVLIAAHHGSKTASSKDFITWLKPQVVIFSTGLHNRYHFPHPAVIARYRQLASLMYNTAHDGAVHMEFNSKYHKVSTKTYRDLSHPWWFKFF